MMSAENSVSEDSNVEYSTVVIQETLEKFLDTANVDKVYGRTIRSGDTIIIPTAEVLCGLGFGIGSGRGGAWGKPADPETGDHGQNAGGVGAGGGGGGRVLSRPVAVIVAGPEGVRVEPVYDRTKVILAALTAAGFVFGMMRRLRSAKFSEA
jgi:uncharacterized spore protein YtfJ